MVFGRGPRALPGGVGANLMKEVLLNYLSYYCAVEVFNVI